METDIPTTVTGQNTEGLSNGNIIAIFFGVFGPVLSIFICLYNRSCIKKSINSRLRKCCPEKRRKSGQRSTDAETSEGAPQPSVAHGVTLPIEMSTRSAGAPESEALVSAQSSNHPAEIAVTSEAASEALIDQTDMNTLSEPEANISGSSSNQAEISETSEEADGSAVGGALFRKRISSCLEKRRNSDPRLSDAENPPSHNPPSEVPLIDQPKMSDQTFYDIYLVSTSEQTPQVDKIKDMCRKNEWKFTTPFGGKLGVLPMQSVQEAVETCSHVVLVITKDDCSKKNLKYSMTIEMAFESVENGELRSKVIPIRCCDRASLPLMLRSLQGSTIGEDDLEERMIKTIDKGIRMKREGQCQSCDMMS